MTRVSDSDRQAVYDRDRWACVICGSSGPLQIHHRSGRRMGGSRSPQIAALSNLIALCLPCHSSTEQHKNDAKTNGWLVSQFADPARCPVVWHGRACLLLPDGTVEDVTPEWNP